MFRLTKRQGITYIGRSIHNVCDSTMNKEVGAWLGIEAKKAYGWLMDASGATPVVELVYQQSVVAVGPCHYFSRQLGATGIGDGHHAFVLAIPNSIPPEEYSKLRIRNRKSGTQRHRQSGKNRLYRPETRTL